jgi:hypothetical protein
MAAQGGRKGKGHRCEKERSLGGYSYNIFFERNRRGQGPY